METDLSLFIDECGDAEVGVEKVAMSSLLRLLLGLAFASLSSSLSLSGSNVYE